MDIPVEIRESSKCSYSGGNDPNTGDPRRGLTPEQERKFLPSKVNVSPSSPNWETAIGDFWANFGDTIFYDGRQLECGVDDKTGDPLKFEDYCLANIAEQDITVHKTDSENDRPMGISYLLIDQSQALEKKKLQNRSKLDANRELMKIIDGDKPELKMTHILAANAFKLKLSVSVVQNMTPEELQEQVMKFSSESPEVFIKEVQSPNLEYKAVIYTGLSYGLISKIPETDEYFYRKPDGEEVPLGSLKQAIPYLKTNSEMYNTLLANIQKAKKLGIGI